MILASGQSFGRNSHGQNTSFSACEVSAFVIAEGFEELPRFNDILPMRPVTLDIEEYDFGREVSVLSAVVAVLIPGDAHVLYGCPAKPWMRMILYRKSAEDTLGGGLILSDRTIWCIYDAESSATDERYRRTCFVHDVVSQNVVERYVVSCGRMISVDDPKGIGRPCGKVLLYGLSLMKQHSQLVCGKNFQIPSDLIVDVPFQPASLCSVRSQRRNP